MYLNLLNLVEINIVSIHNSDNYMIMFLACFPLCDTSFSNLEYGKNISWKLRVLNLCNVYNMKPRQADNFKKYIQNKTISENGHLGFSIFKKNKK